MTLSGWGLGSWGTSPWGTGGASPFLTLVSARPSTVRSVLVELSLAPTARSPLGVGDATNPRTWLLTRGDTGEVIPVYAARMVTATEVELLLMEPVGDFHVTHTVSTDTLLAANGDPINYPRSAAFPGLGFAPASKATPVVLDVRENQIAGEEFANSLVVNTAGDYELEGGIPLLRKKILRRLTSTPGDWAHMPTYGAGLQVKQPLATRQLPSIGAAFERQVELEPEVDAAKVSLEYIPTADGGILRVTIVVRTRKGEEFGMTFPDTEPQGVVL